MLIPTKNKNNSTTVISSTNLQPDAASSHISSQLPASFTSLPNFTIETAGLEAFSPVLTKSVADLIAQSREIFPPPEPANATISRADQLASAQQQFVGKNHQKAIRCRD